MTPDFAEVQKLFRTMGDPDVSDREADRAEKRYNELVPKALRDKLDDYAANPDSPDVERVFREHYQRAEVAEATAADVETSRADTDEEPDEYIPNSEFPDYATNWDGTVICLGGPRKKKKRMRPYPDWAKTKDGRYYPTSYFTLTGGGKRERRTQAQMMMDRRNTVRARKTGGDKESSLPI